MQPEPRGRIPRLPVEAGRAPGSSGSDTRVDAPEAVDRGADQPLDVVAPADVRLDRQPFSAFGLDVGEGPARASAVRAPSTTLAPFAAACRAIARPRPYEPPAMTITCS
jgi:hypothetical protein